MAALLIEDGMVMQLHAGVARNTAPRLLAEFGPNLGAVSPVQGLGPPALPINLRDKSGDSMAKPNR
jgi:glucuronate isomerase